MQAQRAAQILKYLQDGYYIDRSTESLEVSLVTYNAELRVYAHTSVQVTFEKSGRLSMDFAAVGARVDNIVNGLNSEQEYATELLHKCQQGQMILSFELPLLRGMKHTLEALQKPEEDRHRARQVKYLDGNDIRREEMSSPHS